MKTKKIRFLPRFLALFVCIFSVLTSCVKPEVLTLAGDILAGKKTEAFTFEAELKITLNKKRLTQSDYAYFILYSGEGTDVIPDSLSFKIRGAVEPAPELRFNLTATLEDDPAMSFGLFADGVNLYVELNPYSRVAADLVYAAGFIEEDYYDLFKIYADFNSGKLLKFPLDLIDLGYFTRYESYAGEVAQIESKITYGEKSAVLLPETESGSIIDFAALKKNVLRDSYKIEGRRFYQLNFVISEEEGVHYLNTLGETESGEFVTLERLALKSPLEKMERTEGAFMEGRYLPLRYIAELMGNDVLWNFEKGYAYILKTENGAQSEVRFDGVLIGGVTYVSLIEFLKYGNLQLYTEYADEDFVEFVIYRLD